MVPSVPHAFVQPPVRGGYDGVGVLVGNVARDEAQLCLSDDCLHQLPLPISLVDDVVEPL